MSGPDKPTPKDALIEAKLDRKMKNRRRVPSGASQKSEGVGRLAKDGSRQEKSTTDTEPANASESSTPLDTSDKQSSVRQSTNSTEQEASNATLNKAESPSNKSQVSGKIEGGQANKKSPSRRRWWQRRRRGRNVSNKGKENDGKSAPHNTPEPEHAQLNGSDKKSLAQGTGKEIPLTPATNPAATAA
jgi:hypothetical protein